MLKVKTTVKASTIPNADLGLFADQPIKEGRLVWEFKPNFDRKFDAMPRHPVAKEFVIKYGYKPLTDAETYYLCVDNMRFINHSIEPNLISVKQGDKWNLVASRQIKLGEELTMNYTQNYLTDDPGSQAFY